MAERMRFDIPADLPLTLPLLPLRQGFLLPGVVSPFAIARPASVLAVRSAPQGWILVAAQREPLESPAPSDLLPIATLARIHGPLTEGERARSVPIQGVARVALRGFPSTEPYLSAEFELLEEQWSDTPETEGLRRALVQAVEELAQAAGANVPVRDLAVTLERPSLLVDLVASMVDSDVSWKHEVLLTTDPVARAEKVLRQVVRAREVIRAQKTIENKVNHELRSNEREAVLRRQLKAIQDELGDKDDELGDLRARLAKLALPEQARGAVDRELRRLDRLQGQSMERQVAMDWLHWIADLPWNQPSGTAIDLEALESKLDQTHFGLGDVKKQVVEHLAVEKLAGKGRADVLLLVGPPGVGKTSIAQAIADATGRKLVRVALGGVRDEAELRGHRRTYVGSRPGRLVEGLRRVGASDPVVLFDEVDKMGRGWQGDPASALLEILDPEQNHHFVDHYLEVPFDLSKILFIATANDLSAIPAPLRDRAELINIEGYTRDEKLTIAKSHVLKKLAENVGLNSNDVNVSDDAISTAIEGWTREAGVRELQRVLGKIFRAAAVKKAKSTLEAPIHVDVGNLGDFLGKRRFFEEQHDRAVPPGVATGLAWTPMGGDVLYVEASAMPGKGGLVLTGQLGDVMKESAQAALTWVRTHAALLGIDSEAVQKNDLHVHVPAGATPKDGPSAGVTMLTAIASLLTGRAARGDVAMTGEITLRGRVLPVGGIKAKVLAAHARGIRRVILPERNMLDLSELPEKVKNDITFVPVSDMEQVLNEALEAAPRPILADPADPLGPRYSV